MYLNYFRRERWSTQLIVALSRETVNTETHQDVHVPQKTEHDERAARVCQLLGPVEGIARVFSLLYRVENGSSVSEEQMITKPEKRA